jgi:hypothetical protein
MPLGYVIFEWDPDLGPIHIIFSLETLTLSIDFLTKLYSILISASLAPGFGTLTFKKMKVISFFTGTGNKYIESQNYVIALL